MKNCTTYDQGEDTCTECQDGYYKDSDEDVMECVPNPSGIRGCESYESATSCLVCYEDTYLENGVCVTVEEPIDNCLYYESNTACQECEHNYFLSTDRTECE